MSWKLDYLAIPVILFPLAGCERAQSQPASYASAKTVEPDYLFSGTYTNEPGNCANFSIEIGRPGAVLKVNGAIEREITFSSYSAKTNRDVEIFGPLSGVYQFSMDSGHYFIRLNEFHKYGDDPGVQVSIYKSENAIDKYAIVELAKAGPVDSFIVFPCPTSAVGIPSP